MDENYLDNLLNEFSLDNDIDYNIENELDEQITNEKKKFQDGQAMSRDEAFDLDLENDALGGMPDIDLDFSEEQIDELDKLDSLADLDIGDMDFSDIDFDDLDVTKLSGDVSDEDIDELLKDFEGDLSIPDFMSDESSDKDDNAEEVSSESSQDVKDQDLEDLEEIIGSAESDEENTSKEEESSSEINEELRDNADLNEDSFDADSFLDSLLEEDSIPTDANEDTSNETNEEKTEQQSDEPEEEQEASLEDMLEAALEESGDSNDFGQEESNNNDEMDPLEEFSLDDLLSEDGDMGSDNSAQAETSSGEPLESLDDDLLSLLDMDEQPGASEDASAADTSLVDGLDDITELPEDDKPKKKKRTFMEILFGEPDEDDFPTEEELKAKEEKKKAKAAAKEAAKEKKAAKAEKNKEAKSKKDADKKRADADKKRLKAEKKAKKKAALEAEAANAEPEKKLNKPMVIFIFSVFLGGAAFMYLSSVDFNYKLAIQHAANYFAKQKYHKAYDEIKGVEVKEKDKELKERIYTVMYVERLYESYENNISLGRQRKALDSLLRGVQKYYDNYDEAQELDIVSDLDYSFAQIQNALETQYGITLEQAVAINELSDYEYMKTIESYTEGFAEE
ncbi:MAG: hypothetical protein E7271_03450 [Lachnospiraceae bacterium]|nr:hypothetical protein [Lachnospiraceae bacterium]